MKMRSRDYVRQIMSMSRRSLNQGTRAKMGVLSEQGGGDKTKKQGKLFCCFFCAERGHVASKRKKHNELPCPGKDEPLTREVTVKLADDDEENTYLWHWCAECSGWRMHSTGNHCVDLTGGTVDDDEQVCEEDEDEDDGIIESHHEIMKNAVDSLDTDCDEE
jgi:hypothetical protein